MYIVPPLGRLLQHTLLLLQPGLMPQPHCPTRSRSPLCSKSGDILLIQGAVGTKMGTAVQNGSTFFTGLLIGFIKGWRLTLVILVRGERNI